MNKPTFQQLRLQQGGSNNVPIEEIRLSRYGDWSQEYDSMLTFVTYDQNEKVQQKHDFALSKSDAILLITHLKINFGL